MDLSLELVRPHRRIPVCQSLQFKVLQQHDADNGHIIEENQLVL
jgi:hypothetical protein